jgi:hypothetical protein
MASSRDAHAPDPAVEGWCESYIYATLSVAALMNPGAKRGANDRGRPALPSHARQVKMQLRSRSSDTERYEATRQTRLKTGTRMSDAPGHKK